MTPNTDLKKELSMQTLEIKTQGGARKGAGRKRKGEELRESISFSVDPSVKKAARELRERGEGVNAIVSHIIKQCNEKGVVPVPGAEFTIEKGEKEYIIRMPCLKVK